jgi:hypothetical protein
MEIIYRAIDGKEFKDQLECQHHELHLQQGIVMLNRSNERTHRTSHAFLVWLKDENANLAFHAMAESENDDQVSSIIKGEDYGLYYWDEGLEEYRWIDPDLAEGIIKIKEMIDERKDV